MDLNAVIWELGTFRVTFELTEDTLLRPEVVSVQVATSTAALARFVSEVIAVCFWSQFSYFSVGFSSCVISLEPLRCLLQPILSS